MLASSMTSPAVSRQAITFARAVTALVISAELISHLIVFCHYTFLTHHYMHLSLVGIYTQPILLGTVNGKQYFPRIRVPVRT